MQPVKESKDVYLCQWTYTALPVVLHHSEWDVECLPISSSFISSYLSHPAWLHLQVLSELRQRPVSVIFPSWCSYYYRCYTQSLGFYFYFQGFGFPHILQWNLVNSMCNIHTALQELQAAAIMLYRIAFQLSGKVLALHFDNSTANAYLGNQCGTPSLFLSWLAYHILNLANKHGITLIPIHTPIHLNVKANYLSQGRLVPEWHLLPQIAQEAFKLWGQPEVDLLASSCTNQCQHYYTFENPLPLVAFGFNTFNHPWTYQVSYLFHFSHITLSCNMS